MKGEKELQEEMIRFRKLLNGDDLMPVSELRKSIQKTSTVEESK